MSIRALVRIGLFSSLLLAGCTQDGGVNPLNPSSFADQFQHELRFSRAGDGGQGGVIAGDESGVVMLAFRATVDSPSEPVWIDSMTFTANGTGDDTTAVSNVSIYRDVNGNGAVDAGDNLLDSGTFGSDDGRVRFDGFDQAIDHGETKRYVVAYDFNGTANDGDTFRVTLADEDHIVSDGKDSGCPVTIRNLPTKGPEVVVGDTTTPQNEVVVTLGPSTPGARTVGPNATGVAMTQVSLTLSGTGSAEVRNLTFTGSGSADESLDILQVWLFHDVDGDGAVGATDVPLGLSSSYTQDDGTVGFALGSNLVLSVGTPQHVLLVYDLNGNAWLDETFAAGIESSADVSVVAAGTGSPVLVTGLPVDGSAVTIKFGE